MNVAIGQLINHHDTALSSYCGLHTPQPDGHGNVSSLVLGSGLDVLRPAQRAAAAQLQRTCSAHAAHMQHFCTS